MIVIADAVATTAIAAVGPAGLRVSTINAGARNRCRSAAIVPSRRQPTRCDGSGEGYDRAVPSGWVVRTIDRMRYGIIGGGALGLTAALRLSQRGHEAHVLERDAVPGGLA